MGGRLLAVGLTTLDILGRPIDSIPEDGAGRLIEQIEIMPAGTAGGTALVAAALGVDTALVSALGEDRIARFLRLTYEDYGVDTAFLATLPGMTTSATILPIDSQGRRPTLHALGASIFMTLSEEAIEAAKSARYIHWGAVGAPNIDAEARKRFLATAKVAGALVICDIIAPGPHTKSELEQILPYVDYFMPSISEALFLTGTETPEDAAKAFQAMGAQNCIFKLGAEGSFLALGEDMQRLPAYAIEPVDTTSCGDSYCAGFIAALDRGWDIVDACRFATATAALVAQGLGTLGRLESFEATEAFMRQAPLRTN